LRATHAGRSLQLVDFPARKSAALLVALALARQPQSREQLAERFWPDAKNPLASLQTAVYHLRAAFGLPVVGSERGLLTLLFPVQTDVAALEAALRGADNKALASLLRRITLPARFLPDLPAELEDERAHAERVLLDALRAHADAQPASDARRRDALRALLATDPLDTDSREQLIRWHERRGEHDLAAQEQRVLKEALQALGL
jgi:DNA-binding SARP family transcriptional activator